MLRFLNARLGKKFAILLYNNHTDCISVKYIEVGTENFDLMIWQYLYDLLLLYICNLLVVLIGYIIFVLRTQQINFKNFASYNLIIGITIKTNNLYAIEILNPIIDRFRDALSRYYLFRGR